MTIHVGCCLELMGTLAECSVDSVVTDPPYGLGFMGKEWDHGVPGVQFWVEALRVAKPGAYLLAFGGTRTFHRLMCAIEDAGWEIRDTVMWVYGSGFPKSLDVSKAIDKQGGGEGMPENARKAFATELREKRELAGVSRTELASWFPQYSEVTKNWERQDVGFRVPREPDYQVLVDRLGVSESWRLRVQAEDKRRLVAENLQDRRGDETVIGLGHSGKEWESTTEAAKLWSGWGTALKPAWEPIIVARKPLIGTVAKNVQEYGAGGLNIDGCRVPTGDVLTGSGSAPLKHGGENSRPFHENAVARGCNQSPLGRFPANLIHDGSDEVLAVFPQRVGMSGGGATDNRKTGNETIPDFNRKPSSPFIRGDDGSAARFFYCAKASKSDRTMNGQVDNKHPTVKPNSLMRYLCRLVTPPNGLVLDPFCGSGSTGVAAVQEGFRFIGIEKDEDSAATARERLALAIKADDFPLFAGNVTR